MGQQSQTLAAAVVAEAVAVVVAATSMTVATERQALSLSALR